MLRAADRGEASSGEVRHLHHILWARGEPATPPADMPETERSAWSEGIAFYAPYAKRNLAF